MKLDLKKIPVVYMNLEKHVDKNDSMFNMLKQMGFNSIHRVEGILDPENSVAGCSKAHHKALSEFETPFILFEDDCGIAYEDYNLELEIPDDADALYLGVSNWGRMNGHNGFYNQYDILENYDNLLRIYNMLGGHSILYLNEIYRELCVRISHHAGYVIGDYQDVGFAEIQRWFNVYCLNKPMFYQVDHPIGTRNLLTSYQTSVCMNVNHSQFYPYKIK